MGSFSIWHWMVVLLVVLLLFGGGKVSSLMGTREGARHQETRKRRLPR
jgi:Sec-independent protein translocase protein TatA